MKHWIVVSLLIIFLSPLVMAEDKTPRDDKDKKEFPQKAPESALDKAKDRLKEKTKGDKKRSTDTDDKSDFF